MGDEPCPCYTLPFPVNGFIKFFSVYQVLAGTYLEYCVTVWELVELFPRLKLTPTKLNAAEQWISLLFYFLLEEYLTWLIFCIPNYLLNLKNHLTRLHQPCPAWGRPAWVSRSGDTGMELQRGEEGLLFASFLEAVRYFFPVCAPTRLGYSLQFRDITWTGSVPVPVRCKGHIYFH